MASSLYRGGGLRQLLRRHSDDVVILSALRTPVTRARKGGFKDAYDHELLAAVLRATLAHHPTLDPAAIEDITIGTVLAELGGSKAGRMAALHAGFPYTTAFATLNRACASGLAAVAHVAHAIAAGALDVGVAGGMESMSRNYGTRAVPTAVWPALRSSEVAGVTDCVMPMGLTAENVARRYGVTRADQDAFAALSQARAARAWREGWFEEEVVPVWTRRRREDGGEEDFEEVLVDRDDGVRPDTTVEKLAAMKPAFLPEADGGTATAGNSSQISDGAAATLLMRRRVAERLGLGGSIIGKWAGAAVVGCRPDEMGVGPVRAIPVLLARAGIAPADVGVWEINEAFASQALYCVRALGLDVERVNPKGGAIALGHPLGATGVRLLASLMSELGRRGGEVGVVSMCVGTGMGMAGLFVRE